LFLCYSILELKDSAKPYCDNIGDYQLKMISKTKINIENRGGFFMRVCPQCSQVTQETTAFCIRCGYQFQGNEQIVSDEATIRQAGSASLVNIPPNADPSATLTKPAVAQSQTPVAAANVTSQQPVAAVAPQPAAVTSQQPGAAVNAGASYAIPALAPSPGFSPNAPIQNPNQGQSGYLLPPQQQGVYPPVGYGQAPYGAPMAVASPGGLANLQRAFANKGVPVHHQSWLLDSQQVQAATLRHSLIESVHKQGVMGVRATPERLREKGVILEERDYTRVQYGDSSVFVYMAPMGQNLYVSRISTIRQPYSLARIVVLTGLLVLLFISLLFYAVINPSFDASNYGFLVILKTLFGYAFYGLLFFLLFVLLRSFVFWLTDNDFLAFLRPNRLNDFSLDTLSSIEQITDKGIRDTLKQAGLNAEEISKPAQSYAPQQPLHRF